MTTNWTTERLIEHHQKMCDRGRELMVRKNSDYKAGSGDPFANFRSAAWLRCSPETGILLRVQDKMSRIVSFLERGELAVSDESVQDSCIDAVNYLLILSAMLEERRERGVKERAVHPLFSLPAYYGFGFKTVVTNDVAGARVKELLDRLQFTTSDPGEGGYGDHYLYVRCDSSRGPLYTFVAKSDMERRCFDSSQCLAAEFEEVERWLLDLEMIKAVKA